MKTNLSKSFNIKALLKFALPSILMMMLFSLYTIVDGIFISNYIGTTALGALNIIYPFQCLCIGMAIMIASGGSAIVAKKLGEHDDLKARSLFTMFVVVEIIASIIMLTIGLALAKPIVKVLGTSEAQMPYALKYFRIYLAFLPFIFLQNTFQTLFVTAEKPHLGLILIICAGISNIFLDYLFLDICNLGMEGPALGTTISCMIPSLFGLFYFLFNHKGNLYFTKFSFRFRYIKEACFNGSSEMVTNLANAISTFLFNYQCMKFYSDDGVAAITIILYFQFLLSAIFFGYSMGVAPIFSYKYGSGNKKELKRSFLNSLIIVEIIAVISFSLSFLLIKPVSKMFAGDSLNVYQIVLKGFKYYSPAFLLFGTSIFASSFFTALSNGLYSAIISFSRTILFLSISLICLPLILGKTGIWLSVPVAEAIGVLVSIIFLAKGKKKYLDENKNIPA